MTDKSHHRSKFGADSGHRFSLRDTLSRNPLQPVMFIRADVLQSSCDKCHWLKRHRILDIRRTCGLRAFPQHILRVVVASPSSVSIHSRSLVSVQLCPALSRSMVPPSFSSSAGNVAPLVLCVIGSLVVFSAGRVTSFQRLHRCSH